MTCPSLTDEQRTILTLAARGWTDSRIARELGVSASTVWRRIAAAGASLGTRSRIAIVARAAARRLIDVDENPSAMRGGNEGATREYLGTEQSNDGPSHFRGGKARGLSN